MGYVLLMYKHDSSRLKELTNKALNSDVQSIFTLNITSGSLECDNVKSKLSLIISTH